MMKLLAGLDIGNGYVKGTAGVLNSPMITEIDIPSGVAYMTTTHDIKTPADEIPGVIDDIFNKMDVSFESPLVGDTYRRLFGV